MKNTSFPLISVVIPTFNQAPYLPFSLKSVLNQSYPKLEILVIDDGSTDGTEALCREFAQEHSSIHYIHQVNQGPAAARNRGIALSNGEYICLLDGDDLMDSQRISLQYQAFQEDSSLDIVYTALFLIDGEGKLLGEMHNHPYSKKDLLAQLFFRNVIPGPSTIMTKRFCLIENPYNEQFVHAEDYELMLRLAHHYHFKYIDLPLTSYRRHGQNLSNNLEAHRQAELSVLSQYCQTHIEAVVDQTSLNEEEKRLFKGKILYNQEHFEKALSYLIGLKTSLAFFYQGNSYIKLNQSKKALQAYQQANQLNEWNPACLNNLGVIYAQMDQPALARSCFEKALIWKPGYLDAASNLIHQDKPDLLRFTWKELREELIPYQYSG